MDLIFHSLTAVALINRSKIWLAALFGALPDILGLGGLFGWQAYNISHSLIGIASIMLVILLLKLPFELLLFYALHLITDMPSHASGAAGIFYPLPTLVHLRGVDWWTNIWVELIGYGALFMILAFRYILEQKYRMFCIQEYRKFICNAAELWHTIF